MDPLIIISGDGHIGAPVEEYREYLELKYHHLMPEVLEEEKIHLGLGELLTTVNPGRLDIVDDRNRIRSGGETSSWDTERRLQELDAEGIAAEVVFPGTGQAMTPFFYTFNKPYPDDVRMAGTRAYHRWAADMIAPAKGRLIGVAEPGPSINMDETLAELRFVADRGFRGVFVPGYVHNPALPPIFDRHFEPFWAACNDLGLVLHVHAGWGMKQGGFTTLMQEIDKARQKLVAAGGSMEGLEDVFMNVMSMVDEENPDSIFSLDLGPRQAIWQLIFGGVFDRYPKLKLVVAECRADWVAALKTHLDERFMASDKRPVIKLRPSEYFGRNVFITPTSPRPAEVQHRHDIGMRNFLFGADFPHPEGTWPNTLAWLRAVFHDVPEHELRAILGENAIGVYDLDRDWLAGIAAKIGFAPTSIIGDHKVDERVIADFNYRSGFSKMSPVFEQGILDTRVDVDLAATAV